ncbi:MAG: hypothetical protein HHJ16_12455 [Polaromonas sp.]|uniref:DUF5666 domain-containing protein n=1 Tax=Polaromonas sp. TaxID=1869339 RepID=UPI0017C51570|nr:DUF5666 domain-containing protein [Polaromonas sp.]NMM11065.1 hypothetical protein [Polaromonas sp.]
MKTAHKTPAFPRITRREGLLTMLAGALTLAGCGGGGGGGVAGVGGGGTGSLSVGPISGIGSIIVNGVRFDDSIARVLDEDGGSHDRSELKLGMMVRVKGKAVSRTADTASADADEISFSSTLLGPIDSIDTTVKTLSVLGQKVQITLSTIFEDNLSLAILQLSDVVEVHGLVDPGTNTLVATRIERKLLVNVNAFKLQGTVSALDSAAKTFKIGTLIINYAATADVPANLANGLLVRVRIATTPTTGTRTALRVRAVIAESEDHDEAELEGTITDFTSSSKFSVNGLLVDASGATVPAGLGLGVRVQIEGSLVRGVLVAKKVKLEDENDQSKFELHGIVFNRTPTSLTFTLKSSGGIVATVTLTSGVKFGAGITLAGLVNGVKLQVKGFALPDGSIQATSISLE